MSRPGCARSLCLTACCIGLWGTGRTLAAETASPAAPLVINLRAVVPKPVTPVQDARGNPLFLRELYTLRRAEDFRIARLLGFNAVIGPNQKIAELAKRFHFFCTTANWFDRRTRPQKAAEKISGICQKSPVLLCNLNDEPDLRQHRAAPAHLAPIATAIRRACPKLKLSATLAGWGRARDSWPEYAKSLDLIRTDPYPLVARAPLRLVYDQIRAAVAAGNGEKPVLAVLQAWTWKNGPFPTPPQARYMIWQSLIAGAGGISWFDWNDAAWFSRPAFTAAIADANRLIARDLSPFLTRGTCRRFYSKEIAAALWTLPNGQWRLLAARLDAVPGPRNICLLPLPVTRQKGYFLLPQSCRNWPWRGMESRIVTLRPLEVILLASTPLDPVALTPALTSQTTILPLRRNTRIWRCDPAGRPLAPVPRPFFRRRIKIPPFTFWRAFDAGSDPFVDARIRWRVTGDTSVKQSKETAPQAIFRLCPGGIFRQVITLSPGHARRLRLTPVFWDMRETRRAAPIPWLSLQPLPSSLRRATHGRATPESKRFLLKIQVPSPCSWPNFRDHLLGLQLTFTLHHRPCRTLRVIRYRLEPAYHLRWQWEKHPLTSAEWTWTPAFPARIFSFQQKSLIPQVTGVPGLRMISKDNGIRIDFPQKTELPDGIYSLHTRLLTPDHQLLIEQSPANVRSENQRLILPNAPRNLRITQISAAISSNREIQTLLDRIPPARGFQLRGVPRFSSTPTTLKLLANQQFLWCVLGTTSPHELRAETRIPDTPFLGDDVLGVMLSGPRPQLFRLSVNPAGILSDTRILPKYDTAWQSQARVTVQQKKRHWQAILQIPWRAIGWEKMPKTMWINAYNARSIAPRKINLYQNLRLTPGDKIPLAKARIINPASGTPSL